MKRYRIFKKRKGAALALVLMVFAILMVLLTSIVYLTTQDIRETTMQEERLQTYYIASAGIDLTYAALMDSDFEPKKLQTAISKLKNNGNDPLFDSIEIGDQDKIKGIADVTIKRVTIDDKDWLQITSVGKLMEGDTEVTSSMRINEANANQIVREKFGK